MAYTNIDDGTAHFQAAEYTGANSNKSITNDGHSDLQPDLIWGNYVTAPSYTNHRALIDSSRGRAKIINSDNSDAEVSTTNAAYDLVSFDTDGFTVGNVNWTSSLNAIDITYLAYQWKCNGGTTSSNTNGSITSTVQVNADAGFSIVTYTGTGSAGTVGHGLGVAPDTIITKNRDTTANWYMKHPEHSNNYGYISLDQEAYFINNDSVWTQTDPTSTVYSIGSASGISQNNTKMVAYCFAEKQGFSRFGTYYGNQNANGAFAYTGFSPAFILIKSNSNYKYWYAYSNKRPGYNVTNRGMPVSVDSGETSSGIDIDILSNGFKLRAASTTVNTNTTIHYYWAFAENPFVTSSGIPTTAR